MKKKKELHLLFTEEKKILYHNFFPTLLNIFFALLNMRFRSFFLIKYSILFGKKNKNPETYYSAYVAPSYD